MKLGGANQQNRRNQRDCGACDVPSPQSRRKTSSKRFTIIENFEVE